MSFYDSLSAKIYLMEKHIRENEQKPEQRQPWYLSAAWRAETTGHLKIGFYKSLLALVRLGLILRGKPASNFTVFTRAGKDGLYICNYSYCYYKDFHNKTRNKTIATIVAATIILSLAISLIFPGYPGVKAATYNFSQTGWSGGTDGGVYPNHTSNQSNWTKYSAKDADLTAGAATLTLANAASSFLDTTDTDFNAGTYSDTYVSGTDAGASVVVTWYNTNWSYRRSITLSPATTTANYQVNVTLTNVTLTGAQLTAGNANGNDIIFTGSNGTTPQDYWIESWSATGTTVTASIWVEVAASGTSQIYMYYGNSSATSASSGANTFDFFDDFNDGLTTGWNNIGSGMSNPSSFLELATTGGNARRNYSDYVLSGNYEIYYKWRYTDRIGILLTAIAANTDPENTGYKITAGDSSISLLNDAFGTLATASRKNSYSANNWYSMRVSVIYSGTDATIKVWEAGQSTPTIDYTHASAYTAGRIGMRGHDSLSSVLSWDDIRVRKYASSEPAATLGAETTTTGTFTSSVKNTSGSNYWGNIVFNTTLNGGTITMKVRTSNSATMTGAPDWSTCNTITSGTNITANNCVTSPAQYVQYQATLNWGTSSSPSLDDVTIYYGGYVPSATLTSSAFNTQNAGNVLSKLTWNEGTLPANTDVKFQVRTAPDSGSNTPGTWTAWCGPDDGVAGSCSSSTYFTAPAGTETIDDINRDGYLNQWFQYKVWLTSSDGVSTPTLSGISPEYIINTAPSVVSVTASQGSDGVVAVGYNISDAEQTSVNISLLADIGVTLSEVLANSTDPGSGAISVSDASLLPTSGTIQIENEQITYTGKLSNDLTGATRAANDSKYAGHSSGAAVWIKGTTVAGAGNITGITSSSAAKTATWTIKTDLPGVYTESAKIRVSANDGFAGNPVGAADSAVFTLDTKNPSYTSYAVKIDSVSAPSLANNISATTGQTAAYMRFSNSNITSLSCSAASPAWEPYAATKAFSLSPDANGVSTVYWQFKDASCNMVSGSSATPRNPINGRAGDISVPPISKYRILVWWDVVPDPGSFSKYNVLRCDRASADPAAKCDSAANYSLLTTIGSRLTNYCFDEGDGNCDDNSIGSLTTTTKYYYKITAEDIDGISPYSTVTPTIPNYPDIAAIPDGSSYGEMDTVAPVISFTESSQGPSATAVPPTLADTTASMTFSATDNISSAVYLSVAYGTVSGSYTKEAANPSLVNAGQNGTVELSGLSARTTYYYKLKARDISGNIASSEEYSFTTTSDITPPVITFDSASNITATSISAVIAWTTNERATARVDYGVTNSYGANQENLNYNINQSITLSGLSPGQAYYYKLTSVDANGNSRTEDNSGAGYTFTTPAQVDTTPPVITGVYASVVGTNTAIINWTTDKNSSSLVDFGVSTSFGTTQGNSSDSVKTHSITLVGLSPATKYYFQAKSIDSSGNVGTKASCGTPAADCSLTTSADPSAGTLPTISSVGASEITANSAKITWTTGSTEADSTVGYSIDNSYALESGTATPSSGFHNITLTGLAPSTKYYYRVKSRNGNRLATSDNSGAGFDFTTLAGADTIAPSISNVQVTTVTSNKATVTWTTDENANSYVEFGLALASYTSTQGNPNDSATSHSVQIASLTPEKKYYFQVRSSDAAGNKAVDNNSGAGYTFTTTTGEAVDCPPAGRTTICPTCETCVAADVSAPKITNVKVSDITFGSASVTWNTDKASNSMVVYDNVSYGVKQSYGYSSGQLKDSQTSHKVALSNLDPNTTYYFRASSADSRGNTAESEDQSFKTIAIADSKDKGEAATASLKQQFEDIAQTLVKQNLATEENIKDIISRIANPPIIGQEGPVVKDVKSYGATISWQTDRKANSVVKFKAASSPTEALAAGNNWKEIGKMDSYDTKHEVELMGLAPSTTYAFQAKSQDVLGNSTSSETKTFTTSSNSSIFNVNVTDITLNSAKINWETVNISTSLVEYGLASGYGNQTNKGDEKVRAHSVELANLSSGTNYHFRIRSVEESGNILSTEDYTFATYQLPQITKYDLGEIKDNSIELKWTSNLPIDSNIRYTDKDTNETKIIGAPEKSLDHSIVLPDLSAGKSYKIEIQGRDEAGNLAELPAFEAQTGIDTVPPEISQVRSQAAILGGAEDKVQAIISWKTNELSTSQVLWDMGTTKGDTFANVTKSDSNLTTNHISVITNFKPGTVYRFRVASLDKFGNASVSPDYSILTPVRRQSVVQMIMSNFEKIFGWTKNLGR